MNQEQPPAPPNPPAPPPPPAPPDPRRRMRELLAVPERDRTDAQWDELNELEIQLAPGNRINPQQGGGGQSSGGPGGGGGGAGGGGQKPPQAKKNRPRWTGNRQQPKKTP